MNREHVLVIGGTGMLKEASLWFSEHGYIVSVIGRTPRKHESLAAEAANPEFINSLTQDYTNHSSLERQLIRAMEKYGPFSIVVSWVSSLPSLEFIIKIVSEHSSGWKLYQVKGSKRYFEDDVLQVPPNCKHRSIYLGFVIEGNTSR
ncbi:hypothetical protein SAMN04487936_1053 [Halobacillus dabanensis]|uniref:Short chain dehydrogenase n=1 Tax=Halobacillus dabanensis TaxID=240302 RepID=A0A1I3UXA7_HALDA|nr:hypothetical protein [Halobacillus dabanensis]SFJ86501.1 hypothetical protein SAMN04487936_1053 [Halobacillus dabanensis]